MITPNVPGVVSFVIPKIVYFGGFSERKRENQRRSLETE
jgi:hypothetical protein